MTRKAQSALEYLMTYGWAILIIVIVGAALFALGVFNPGESTALQIRGLSNFQISDAQFTTDGNYTVVLGTRTGKTTTVSSMDFSVQGTSCAMVNDTSSTSITPSQTKTVTSTANGGCSLTSGDRITVDTTITYTVAGSSLTKQDTGSVSLNVQ